MRPGQVIDRVLFGRFGSGFPDLAPVVIRALREEGWHLVRATHEVEDPDPDGTLFGRGQVERLSVDVEGEGIHDVRTEIHPIVLRERHAVDIIRHHRRDMVIQLAVATAERLGWLA